MVGHLSAKVSIRGTLREGSFTGEPFFFFSSSSFSFFFFYFFFEPEDVKGISLGVIWNLGGITGLP